MILREDQDKKKKGIALKGTTEMEEDLDDENLVLLTRIFKCFFKNRPFERKESQAIRKGGYVTCFKWQNSGHIRADYPILNKDKFEKKKR